MQPGLDQIMNTLTKETRHTPLLRMLVWEAA